MFARLFSSLQNNQNQKIKQQTFTSEQKLILDCAELSYHVYDENVRQNTGHLIIKMDIFDAVYVNAKLSRNRTLDEKTK